MKKKIINITQSIFAYAIAILMILALIVATAFVIAFIIGGTAGEAICLIMQTYVMPPMYVSCAGSCLIGLVNIYARNEHTFVLTKKDT